MNIHDVLSPTAIALAKTIGYGVFLIAGVVIALAWVRIQADARAAYNRYRQQHW